MSNSSNSGVSTLVTSAAVDHVRLSYRYLNDGDVEGYASLLSENVVIAHPGLAPIRGARAAEEARRALPWKHGKLTLHTVFGNESTIVALGVVDTENSRDDFADDDVAFDEAPGGTRLEINVQPLER